MKLPARIAALVVVLVGAGALIGQALAAGGGGVIDVRPGELREAIARADDGDTLRLHEGRYTGRYTIAKRLKLVGAPGERRPLIDGRCQTRATIRVVVPGVVIRRLHVVGSDESGGPFPSSVEFIRVRSGRITDSLLRDTCEAEYGVNVFASQRITVLRNRTRGFSDAGIYVGAISSTGGGILEVADNETFRNNLGVIVEDSSGGTIVVNDNLIRDNTSSGEGIPSGIFVRRSDAASFSRNRVVRNGEFGIHLDPASERNRFFANRVRSNPRNVFDQGTGNCGRGNVPNAFPACP
jgi:parallel beta-helix repeat protein